MIRKTDIDQIKRDMMELWKNTFNYSSRYIKLVFDTYFSPDNIFYEYDGEKLVAGLLGVEYEFQVLDKDNHLKSSKGMYLCGLATLPDYRRRGIMSKLMTEAENSAKARGFVLTFLIPADSQLRQYYAKKGYVTASYKRYQIAENRNFGGIEKMNIYTFQDFLLREKFDFLRQIAQWCIEREEPNEAYVTLKHSEKDFLTIMSENENSFFLTEISFDPEYPILAKVKGVVFPTVPDETNREWGIVGLYLREKEKYISYSNPLICLPKEILSAIHSLHPEYKLEIKLPYTGENCSFKEPYAMIKILTKEKKLRTFENKAYKISLMLD